MESIKKRKFTLLDILILIIYGLLIWPYPEHYPLLTHSLVGLIVLILSGILTYLDERKINKQIIPKQWTPFGSY